MANLSLTTEMSQVLDQRQVWFTNLLLLGFDPVAQEDKTKVRFCREMFCHINKKGMEVILHYLFNKLDSHLAYEEFRDCWPVYDKKQEAQFRKVCVNWLTRIAKEDPNSKLPRLAASLLMSPGGDRFDHLMLRLTTYVLRVVCLREAKGEEKQVFLSSFVTSPDSLHTSTNRHLLQRALHCHIIRHSRNVTSRLELVTALHEQWRQFASEQVKEYRSLAKQKRELEEKVKVALNTPAISSEGISAAVTPTADKTRKNKMKVVRGFWKSLEEFQSKTVHEREVIGAVTKGNANRYAIDAKDLQFQIPDVILPMYEAQLREGKAGNTVEGGKLNLLSLLQLWNCSLQVLRDRFREYELPSFQAEAEHMKEALQAHRTNLAAAQNLRASLMEYQHSLQESIDRLEQELQVLRGSYSQPFRQTEGEEGRQGLPPPPQLHIPPITLPSLGLELLPPSPQKSHDASSPDMQHLQSHLSLLSLPNDTVSTPEAVHNISRSIQRASRSEKLKHAYPHSSSIPRRIPVSSESGDQQKEFRINKSEGINSSTKSKKQKKRITKTKTQPPVSTCVSKIQPPVSTCVSGVQHVRETTPYSKAEGSSRRELGYPYTKTAVRDGGDGGEGGDGADGDRESVHKRTAFSSALSPKAQKVPTQSRLLDTMPAAHDILATQIASAVVDNFHLDSSPRTPEQIHSLNDPVSALSTEAFISRDRIPRTPVSTPGGMQEPREVVMAQQDTPTVPVTSTATIHSTPRHAVTTTPLHTVITTPLHNVTTTPLHPATTTPLHPVTTTPLHTVITTPLHNVTTTPLHPATTTPLHPITTTPLHPATTTPLHPATTTPLHTVTTIPLHTVTTTPLHTVTTTPQTASQHTPYSTPHSTSTNEIPLSTPATRGSALAFSQDSPSPILLSRSSHLHTPSPLSATQPQSSRLYSGLTDQETLISSPPPLLLLDSPARLASPYTPSTVSVPLPSHQTLPSFHSPLLSSSAHSHSPVVSQSGQANQLVGSKEANSISFINPSPSTPLGSIKPATTTITPSSAHIDLLSFGSPTLGLPPPLVGMSPLQLQQLQSPLVHLSSSLQQYSPLTLSKDTLTFGNQLQSNLVSPVALLSTSGRISTTPSHTAEGLLSTTHNPHMAAHKVSSLTAARTMDTSPTVTTTPVGKQGETRDTSTLVATSDHISIKSTSEISPTTVGGIFPTPTHATSFLLTSQPPTPFLHADLSSSEEGERDNEQQPSSPLLHCSVNGEVFQTGENEESFGIVADNDTELRQSEEEIPPGLNISTTQDGVVTVPSHQSPSAHVAVSKSPQCGQLLDFSSTSDEDWRPLDVSGDPSSPLYAHHTLDHSLKAVEEDHHISSNGGIGLFDENDSFLVPLSPHSDLSLNSHEDAH